MADLVSTTVLMQALKVRTSREDVRARYDLLRTQVEQAIRDWCKWELDATTGQIDYYDGCGHMDLVLRRPYVSEITQVRFDMTGAYGKGPNAFPAATQMTDGQDYVLKYDGNVGATAYGKSGLLRRLSNVSAWFPSDMVFGRLGGLAYNKGPYWPAGSGNIKVTYNYGFATVPADIQLAVETAVGTIVASVKYGFPVQSEGLGAHNYSLAIAREPEFGTVRQILGKYRDSSL